MSRTSLIIRVLLAFCLLIATANHLRADFTYGWLWDYGYGASAGWCSRVFWGVLTFLDPLAALLLLIRPRMGIGLTVAIMMADVAHNSWYVALNHQWLETFYLSQVAFLVLVLIVSPLVWKRTVSARDFKEANA